LKLVATNWGHIKFDFYFFRTSLTNVQLPVHCEHCPPNI